MKNMANRLAALEGRKATAVPQFPIYIKAAGVPEERIVGITGAGVQITRGSGESVEELKDRAREALGEKPSLPMILSYIYDDAPESGQ